MNPQKTFHIVTPANAVVRNILKILDSYRTRSGIRRNDRKRNWAAFYEFITFYEFKNYAIAGNVTEEEAETAKPEFYKTAGAGAPALPEGCSGGVTGG